MMKNYFLWDNTTRAKKYHYNFYWKLQGWAIYKVGTFLWMSGYWISLLLTLCFVLTLCAGAIGYYSQYENWMMQNPMQDLEEFRLHMIIGIVGLSGLTIFSVRDGIIGWLLSIPSLMIFSNFDANFNDYMMHMMYFCDVIFLTYFLVTFIDVKWIIEKFKDYKWKKS